MSDTTDTNAVELQYLSNPVGKKVRLVKSSNPDAVVTLVHPWDDESDYIWAETDNGGRVRLNPTTLVQEV